MAVYVSLTTSPFAQVFTQQQGNVTPSGRAGISTARRPLRGLEIDTDTYAILKVIQSNGQEIPLVDSGALGGTNTQNSNFILQSVSEARMEKHQIVETFGDPYIFFFGESPRFLDVTAVLVDSFDFNWVAEFWENYDQYLRGSQSVQIGARTYLFYEDNIVEGYMLMASARKTSETPLMAQLSFRLFITSYQNISLIGSDVYPVHPGFSIPPDATITNGDAYTPNGAAGAQANNQAYQAQLQQLALSGATLGGFGGTSLLTSALTGGVQPTGNVALYETEITASYGIGPPYTLSQDQALDAITQAVQESADPTVQPLPFIPRTLPVRSLISDNHDELTGQTPPAPGQDDPSTSEAPDLSTTAIQQVDQYGGDINDPSTFAALGLGPNFGLGVGVGIGIGLGGGAVVAASFGVTGGVGLTGVYGGINGGLGFIGGSGIGASASLSIATPTIGVSLEPAAVTVGISTYGNGVQLSGGIIAGTGVGGGIPGGLSGPGGLMQFTGGTAFAVQQATSMGYGAGISGNGVSIEVGGAPSAFAIVVTEGTLFPQPSAEISFYTDTDGSSSEDNQTGLSI